MSVGTKNRVEFRPPGNPSRVEKQLRRDRKTAIVVVAVMLVVMALAVWLASVSGGPVQDGIEYWPMMP